MFVYKKKMIPVTKDLMAQGRGIGSDSHERITLKRCEKHNKKVTKHGMVTRGRITKITILVSIL